MPRIARSHGRPARDTKSPGGASAPERPSEVTEDTTERRGGTPAGWLLPSDLVRGVLEGRWSPPTEVALDTETSGLFADSGARVSTVSVAWEDLTDQWRGVQESKRFDNVTVRDEDVGDGRGDTRIVSMAWPFDQGVSGKPEDNGQETLFPEPNLPRAEWRSLLAWLSQVGGLVMHNGKFDCEKMRIGVRRWPGDGIELIDQLEWDTQNVNALLWSLDKTGLKPTATRLFGVEAADEQGKVKEYLRKAKLPVGRWDLMPWDIVGPYADMDARLTLMLKLRQETEVLRRNLMAAVDRRLATTRVLYRMERRGLPYAREDSIAAGQEVRSRAAQIARKLPFEGPTEARKFFFGSGTTKRGVDCLDLVPYAVTEGGQASITAEILDRMVADEVEWAGEYAEHSKVTKAASMWYEGYAEACGTDGRLRTCFRQNGTRSSRFSVERVNLQAIPHDYRLSGLGALDGIPTPRKLIAKAVADTMPGWKLWELDLAQAELRVAAMFAGCDSMLSMITNSEDLHAVTTRSLFNVDESDPKWGQWRQVGKRANFSLIFGAKGRTFQQMIAKETGIRFSEQEAHRLVAAWNRLYPEFDRALQKHQRVVEKRQATPEGGWLEFINGERRWFQQYEEPHKAFNQRVQGNLAQYGIDWMLASDDALVGHGLELDDTPMSSVGEPLGSAGLLLVIHDSQVVLVPDDEMGAKMVHECAEIGKKMWRRWFPGVPGDIEYKEW